MAGGACRRTRGDEQQAAPAADSAAAARRTGGSGPASLNLAGPGSLLTLQRAVGNRAVGRVLLQRSELYVSGGGHVSSVDGPGTNEAKAVAIVQERMIALGVLTKADADADRARVKARKGRIMAADITHTTDAIPKCDTPTLSEPSAKKVLRIDMVSGVGQGEANDAADVELVLNILHEEWHVTNDEFDRGTTVLAGSGRTVDPAAVPGFLAGLTKLRKGFAEGYPFRGPTKRRRGLLVTEGTAAYQHAVDYNTAGRVLLKTWLDGAAAQHKDLVLRNSAEWCLAGKSKIFCTTKTHDSAARVKAEHQPSRFEAVFGYPQGAITEAQVPYLRKLKGQTAFDNTNVLIQPPEGGSQRGGDILFEDPAHSGKGYFLDTIRHEVQHAADHSGPGDEGDYQTEINARWIETRFAGYSTRRNVRRMGYTWKERQFAAFYDMWTAPDLYPYLRANWNQSDAAKRAAWRAMVVGYQKPTSANPVNSVRIENLTAAVEACSPADCDAHDAFVAGTGAENPKAKAVRDALGALDPLDRSTVPSIASLKASAASHLKGSLKTDFDAIH